MTAGFPKFRAATAALVAVAAAFALDGEAQLSEALDLEPFAQAVLSAEQRVDDLGRAVGPLRQRAQRQRLRTLFVQHASGEIEQTSAHHGVALGAGALVIESDLEGVHW